LRRQAIAAGEPIVGDPQRWLNLIQIDDGVAAILAAEHWAGAGGIYNIADGCPVSRREFFTLLARLLRAPEPRWVPPAPTAPMPPHERANRRIGNRRLLAELRVQLRYPSCREGLPASVD
jgi:nucleoside-diphosphate-sugar epimerase